MPGDLLHCWGGGAYPYAVWNLVVVGASTKIVIAEHDVNCRESHVCSRWWIVKAEGRYGLLHRTLETVGYEDFDTYTEREGRSAAGVFDVIDTLQTEGVDITSDLFLIAASKGATFGELVEAEHAAFEAVGLDKSPFGGPYMMGFMEGPWPATDLDHAEAIADIFQDEEDEADHSE